MRRRMVHRAVTMRKHSVFPLAAVCSVALILLGGTGAVAESIPQSAPMTRTAVAGGRSPAPEVSQVAVQRSQAKLKTSYATQSTQTAQVATSMATVTPSTSKITHPSDYTLYTSNKIQSDGDYSSITAGADGNIWFSASGATQTVDVTIQQITPTGTVSTYSDPAFLKITHIIAGPGGAIWFTTQTSSGSSIGELTDSGTVKIYTALAMSSDMAITAGPDGDVWFTAGYDQEAKLAPSGTVTVYTDGAIQGSSLITNGADGALWFTEETLGLLGRITENGTVTTYSDSQFGYWSALTGAPQSTIAGGTAVWFSDGELGSITTSGAVVLYPSTNGVSGNLAAGPGGGLWFNNINDGALQEVTPSGSIKSYGGFDGIPSVTIASGPGDSIWFTVSNDTSIGEFTDSSAPLSVVSLGDSIAAGEGIGYGYSYDPSTSTWGSGLPDPTWSGPYSNCHDTPEAYGGLVAAALGATFTQLACTGATYTNGITGVETTKPGGTGIVRRPVPEFGTSGNIDPAYAAATPNVVLITFGADDVDFSDIVQSCYLDPEYPVSKQPGPPPPNQSERDCTTSHPGPVFEQDFPHNSSQLTSQYAALVNAIDAQAAGAGRASPKIVFTNYMDPFPDPYVPGCPDLGFLNAAQVDFLNKELDTLNTDIQVAVHELNNPDVGFADISNALAGHTWCDSDPWDYGLSVLAWKTAITGVIAYLPTSQAPFHPTAAGQDAIARDVLPVVDGLLGITASQPTVNSADGDPSLADGVTAAAGAAITGSATGFTPGGTVTVTLDTSSTPLQTLTAGTDGGASFSTTVPVGTPSGQHQLIITDSTTGAAATLPVFIPLTAAAPSFTAESPPLTATTGTEYYYPFTVHADPGARFSLGGDAPSWLYIDNTGDVYGTPPAGTTSFAYSVTATNPSGSASVGPFTVTAAASSKHR